MQYYYVVSMYMFLKMFRSRNRYGFTGVSFRYFSSGSCLEHSWLFFKWFGAEHPGNDARSCYNVLNLGSHLIHQTQIGFHFAFSLLQFNLCTDQVANCSVIVSSSQVLWCTTMVIFWVFVLNIGKDQLAN